MHVSSINDWQWYFRRKKKCANLLCDNWTEDDEDISDNLDDVGQNVLTSSNCRHDFGWPPAPSCPTFERQLSFFELSTTVSSQIESSKTWRNRHFRFVIVVVVVVVVFIRKIILWKKNQSTWPISATRCCVAPNGVKTSFKRHSNVVKTSSLTSLNLEKVLPWVNEKSQLKCLRCSLNFFLLFEVFLFCFENESFFSLFLALIKVHSHWCKFCRKFGRFLD